jgi:hypothetical protein
MFGVIVPQQSGKPSLRAEKEADCCSKGAYLHTHLLAGNVTAEDVRLEPVHDDKDTVAG